MSGSVGPTLCSHFIPPRNSSCVFGRPSVADVMSGSALPASRCNCSDTTLCAPVATGLLSLVAPGLNSTVSLQVGSGRGGRGRGGGL